MSKTKKLPASGIKDSYIAAKERWARKMAGQAPPSALSAESPVSQMRLAGFVSKPSYRAFGINE